MRDFACRPERERGEVFRAAAQAMRVHEAIVEKDFWVCWVLDYLFHDSPWHAQMAFKGGTSLSKAFAAIERFSEDIDLILDWRVLGCSKQEAWADRSATQQDIWNKAANQRATQYLQSEFAGKLQQDLSARAGMPVGISTEGQDVLVHYPRAFSLMAIQPQIRLEIGPLAAWVPNEEKAISPYAAAHFPHVFRVPQTMVRTIAAARTFWEKATILHQEAHRPPGKAKPLRQSRHYYDLFRLSRTPICQHALTDPE